MLLEGEFGHTATQILRSLNRMPTTLDSLSGHLAVPGESVRAYVPHGFEAATTQTEDMFIAESSAPPSYSSSATSVLMTTTSPAAGAPTAAAVSSVSGDSCYTSTDDDDCSEADSVFDRLTRRVGRLFKQDRRDRGTQTTKDPLASETEKLAFDTIFFVLGKRGVHTSDETVLCLRQCVSCVLQRHSLVFDGMIVRLNVNTDTDFLAGFMDMSEELFFPDNVVTWGKIVVLFAFGAKLALYCHEHNMGDKVYAIATTLSQIAVERVIPFLRRNGGWATLLQLFPVDRDYETKIWRSLIFTGLCLTVLATFLVWQR